MLFNILPFVLLTQLSVAAHLHRRTNIKQTVCNDLNIIFSWANQPQQIQQYCSSVLSIKPVTTTTTTTSIMGYNATTTNVVTTTVYPTVTTSETATCALTPLVSSANPTPAPSKRDTWPNPLSSAISSACSCLSLTTPTSTVTSIVTTSSAISTITSFTTTTITGSTSTSTTIVATVPFIPTGNYIATDSDAYVIYGNTDFYGYNYYSGYCGSPDGVVDTPYGNYTCATFDDCMNICSFINHAPGNTEKCLGVSFTEGLQYCFTKYAVPGNGAPSCEVVNDPYPVDSAALVVVY